MKDKNPQDFVYGFHAISALARQSPASLIVVYLEKNKTDARTAKLIQLLRSHDVSYQFVSRNDLQTRVGAVVHQGVVAQITIQVKNKVNDLETCLSDLDETETILILDGIQDPANLGGCLRVADAAGVSTIILPKDKSASVTAVARKVAAGAAESVNIVTVTNLVRAIETLKEYKFWIYGLADETPTSLYAHQFVGQTAIVMGNEGKGLRRLTREACDQLLSIPMYGQVESLNVTVATAITLYEINRQRNAQ